MKLVDIADPPAPPAVERYEAGEFTAEDLEALVALGGPQTRRIVELISASPVIENGCIAFAESFNALAAEHRRTSELSGLFQAAAELGLATSAGKTLWACRMPDGGEVAWQGADLCMSETQFARFKEHVST